jgi:hypothetical protein
MVPRRDATVGWSVSWCARLLNRLISHPRDPQYLYCQMDLAFANRLSPEALACLDKLLYIARLHALPSELV